MGPPPRQRPDPVPILSSARRRARTLRAIVRNAHSPPELEDAPLVSVVLPTYNWSSVLRHAMRSVLWQTYPNLELLVIGDCCTDDSEQMVASFGDPRVRWHNLERNTGNQAIPNNIGLDLAQGEYIAYQGHDDVWHPAHLRTAVSHLRAAQADLSYSIAEVMGPPESRVRFLAGRVRPADLAPGAWLPPASLVHRAELGERVGGWLTWEEAGGPPDVSFLDRVQGSGAALVRVPALTVFKFPSFLRPGSYRERPSHEQGGYVRRIERERFFIERELVAVALRRLSPRKPRIVWQPTMREAMDPMARYAYIQRLRGLG